MQRTTRGGPRRGPVLVDHDLTRHGGMRLPASYSAARKRASATAAATCARASSSRGAPPAPSVAAAVSAVAPCSLPASSWLIRRATRPRSQAHVGQALDHLRGIEPRDLDEALHGLVQDMEV